MKKYLNIALAYAIAAMVGGVFYREFTKYSGFTRWARSTPICSCWECWCSWW